MQGVDPFSVLEQVLAENDMSADERQLVEQARAHLVRIIEHFDDEDVIDALHATCLYGIIVGRYIKVRDPATLAKIDSCRGELAGKKSGEKRQKKIWHKHATELAIAIRRKKPWLSQLRLAEEIASQWASRFNPPGIETLKKWVSALERDGTIPRATKRK
jgi:hypothetical protein